MKQDVTVKFAEHLIYSAGAYSFQGDKEETDLNKKRLDNIVPC